MTEFVEYIAHIRTIKDDNMFWVDLLKTTPPQ